MKNPIKLEFVELAHEG